MERHPERATDLGVHMVHLAGESVGRNPFGHGTGLQECAIDLFGFGAKHAVKSDTVGWHGFFALLVGWSLKGVAQIKTLRPPPSRRSDANHFDIALTLLRPAMGWLSLDALKPILWSSSMVPYGDNEQFVSACSIENAERKALDQAATRALV